MKRVCLLMAALAALMVGCGRQLAEVPEATPAPTAVVTATPTPTAIPTPTPTPVLVTMEPTSVPTPVPTPTPTPTATPTPTPAPTPFSLAWVPDTQHFAYFDPQKFLTLAERINERRESDNILGVIHSGDLVDNGFKSWQWDNFDPFLENLDPSLFFFPVAGNHDIGTQAQEYYAYLPRPFLKAYPDEQKYDGGKVIYRVLSEGGEDILLLGIGWNMWMDRGAMGWTDEVLAAHPDMPCILVIHGFLLSETGYYQSVEQMIAARPTIRLVLCGHMDGYYTHVFTYDDDGDGVRERTVTAMMLNMQRAQDYAFRILTFDPLSHAVTVNTLLLDGSPAPDYPNREPISFTIENAY